MKRVSILLSALLVVSASYLLGWSNLLPVKNVYIEENDESIIVEITEKLTEEPRPIVIGKPIARVDRREIALRLRELIWVDEVDVKRNFISGEVKVSVSPRSALAQLDSKWSANPADASFLSTELEIFYVPKTQVAKATQSGDVDWLSLPALKLGADDNALKEDVRKLLVSIEESGGKVKSVTALNREELRTFIQLDERDLDILWGSVNEFSLKFEVLNRLLELKANRNAKRIDLTSPSSPIVSNNSN